MALPTAPPPTMEILYLFVIFTPVQSEIYFPAGLEKRHVHAQFSAFHDQGVYVFGKALSAVATILLAERALQTRLRMKDVPMAFTDSFVGSHCFFDQFVINTGRVANIMDLICKNHLERQESVAC